MKQPSECIREHGSSFCQDFWCVKRSRFIVPWATSSGEVWKVWSLKCASSWMRIQEISEFSPFQVVGTVWPLIHSQAISRNLWDLFEGPHTYLICAVEPGSVSVEKDRRIPPRSRRSKNLVSFYRNLRSVALWLASGCGGCAMHQIKSDQSLYAPTLCCSIELPERAGPCV